MRPLLLLLFFATPAPASVKPDGPLRLPHSLRESVVPPKPEAVELTLTDASEVYLDGKRCKLADVPDGCEVTELVVDVHNRVLVIRFKSPASPPARPPGSGPKR